MRWYCNVDMGKDIRLEGRGQRRMGILQDGLIAWTGGSILREWHQVGYWVTKLIRRI
jgi:hypothetical protein